MAIATGLTLKKWVRKDFFTRRDGADPQSEEQCRTCVVEVPSHPNWALLQNSAWLQAAKNTCVISWRCYSGVLGLGLLAL